MNALFLLAFMMIFSAPFVAAVMSISGYQPSTSSLMLLLAAYTACVLLGSWIYDYHSRKNNPVQGPRGGSALHSFLSHWF